MNGGFWEFLAVGIYLASSIGLLATLLIPSWWARRWAVGLGNYVSVVLGLQAWWSVAWVLWFTTQAGEPWRRRFFGTEDGLIEFGISLDGAASLQLALVSLIGWAICRYSIRYLEGEASQGRFFQWTSLTLCTVSWMVVAPNLMQFVVAWALTSVGLHQLLLFYPDRPLAQRAAWTKFVVSRLGDIAMVAAAVLLYRDFGTLDFAKLAQTTTAELQGSGAPSQWAASLIVLGALAKSALIPFHSWLPLTLDAPTPVSALMHAGIVNAGGYLMIRMSSFLVQHPQALAMLAIMGGATAGLGALIMMTQSSIKQKLAYSTVAQMGFMMLQCGMGAFTAAMLHIVAHAMYKAYAFMNSGNVLVEERQSRAGVDISRVHWRHSILAFVLSVVLYLGVAFLLRQDLLSKPGGLLLGLFFSYAVSPWLATTLFHRGGVSPWVGLTIALGLQLVYGLLSLWVDRLIANSAPIVPSLHQWVATLVIVIGFSVLQYFQWKIGQPTAPSWLRVWRVHASNRFYVDVAMQRVFGPFFAR